MKLKLNLGLLFPLILLFCANLNATPSHPKKIVITGKVENYKPSKEISVHVNRLGYRDEGTNLTTDSLGNFTAIFESYIPTDVWLQYNVNFLVLVHPGDSLHVIIDGSCVGRVELLSSARFEGKEARINQQAAKLQQMFFGNPVYSDWDKKNKAVKEYDVDQYSQYLDTIKAELDIIYDKFVVDNNPDEEVKIWASAFLYSLYYNCVYWYARDHRRTNNMVFTNAWDVPKGFYDRMLPFLPITPEKFISGYSLNLFVDRFDGYVTDNLRGKKTNGLYNLFPGGGFGSASDKYDSLRIQHIIKYVDDPLLRQIMLAYFIHEQFEKQSISAYDQFQEIREKYITEPFVKEPLHTKYILTKNRLEKPELYTSMILKDVASSSTAQVMDTIIQSNQGKVIYIDFWATWCGPCIGEFPNSKTLNKNLDGKNITFVYVCLESDELKWKATLDKFKLEGQHYLLNREQSAEMRKIYGISGIPFYVLIDSNGTIIESGSHLRPLAVENKIKELLK